MKCQPISSCRWKLVKRHPQKSSGHLIIHGGDESNSAVYLTERYHRIYFILSRVINTRAREGLTRCSEFNTQPKAGAFLAILRFRRENA